MDKENISWKLIDKYFNDNPNCLVSHHLESFNEFFKSGIKSIFHENNPIRFIERLIFNIFKTNTEFSLMGFYTPTSLCGRILSSPLSVCPSGRPDVRTSVRPSAVHNWLVGALEATIFFRFE